MAAQVVFYSCVVAPVAIYLWTRMATLAILMSIKRFREKFPDNSSNNER